MYVPVRVNPEQPVIGAVLGVLKVEQVAAPDLADRFVRMAREKGGPCSRLAFELTESRSLRGTDGVPLLIRQLFAAGAAITVDGFGAGHSNLTRILGGGREAGPLCDAHLPYPGPEAGGRIICRAFTTPCPWMPTSCAGFCIQIGLKRPFAPFLPRFLCCKAGQNPVK